MYTMSRFSMSSSDASSLADEPAAVQPATHTVSSAATLSSAGPLDSNSITSSSMHNRRRGSEASSINYNRASSATPNSWYAALATEPPKEEDFWADSDDEDFIAQWLQQPRPAELKSPDEPPSRSVLEAAGDLPVYNADGNALPFKNLFLESQDGTSRQLIIFIRHFFCRACRTYIRELKSSLPDSRSIDPASSPHIAIPTQIILVSPMKPHLIRRYAESNCIQYPIYADPSCRVFRALGCKTWGWFGKRPKYLANENGLVTASKTLVDNYTQLLIGKGRGRGPIFQVGGEFLFEEGQVSWCHRMRDMRNHTEVDDLKRILDLDAGGDYDDQDLTSFEIPIILEEESRPTRQDMSSSSHLHNESSPSPVVRTGSFGSDRRVPNKLKKKSSRLWNRRATGESL